jgi:ATP-binding cassette subfamily B multidrug efflux pump
MLTYFEKLIDPFPSPKVEKPPSGFVAFCWYHTRAIWPYLIAVSVLVAIIAILEVLLFGFLGNLVDWFNSSTPQTILAEHGSMLVWMVIVIAILMPFSSMAATMLIEQTINGNYPMLARWRSHRYLLGQSMNFYQDDFAGRIATKVMQTSISIREAVMKLVDILVYVLTYFIGIVIMVALLDWRLAVPFGAWLGIYCVLIWYFVPRLGRVAKKQADARSLMTGQVVDAYTNITTVKLFSHAEREADYTLAGMKDFLQTVYRQMRLSTWFQIYIQFLNSALPGRLPPPLP